MQLYGVYLLIILNLLICSFINLYLTFILGIVYLQLIKEFNRIGFINQKMVFLSIVCMLYMSITLRITHYLIYLTIGVLMILFMMHIPYRPKMRKIFNHIELSQSINIFNNRISQNNRIFEFGFEIRRSEIDWLTKRILFRSTKLKDAQWVYMDNEIIGNNFHVNIV